MKKIIAISFVLINIFCMTMPSNKYVPESKDTNFREIKKSLQISPFNDLRKGINEDRSILAFIPFFAYGTLEKNFPEETETRASIGTPIKFYFANSFKAELGNRYKFKELFISEQEDSKNSDFRIEGEINKYKCNQFLYTYGLSLIGPLLWYFAAPAIRLECELEIKISLKNNSNLTLLEKKYIESETIWSGLYYNLFSTGKIHRRITKQMILDFIKLADIHLKN